MKNENMKKILYIGDVGVPNTALAIHAQNIARIFYKLGYHTTFICDGKKDGNIINEKSEIFDYYYTKKYIKLPKISILEWLFDEITGWKYKKILYDRVEEKKPDLILMYGYAGEKWLIKYCLKNRIPFLIERVDWFEKDDRNGFIGKQIIQRYVDNCIMKKDKLVNGVIAISKYFEKYYNELNKTTIFIPPIFEFDLNRKIKRFRNDKKLRLVYAGSLGGNKDQILPALQAIKKINKDKIQIIIDVIGPTIEEIEEVTLQNDWNKYGIKAYGRMTNSKTQAIIEKADFSLLLRKNKKYAKAGFSTKFAESMCLGVPVICTKVGGADLIITDMIDGVHLKDNNVDTIENILQCLLKKESEEILQMKKNAYKKACEIFYIENYVENLKEFLKKVKVKSR